MATWMVHCRISDYFINKLKNIDKTEFALGNFAPDCGYGVKDSLGEFDPPPKVTHWSPSGRKRDCRYKDFYNAYLKDKEKGVGHSFYLGYYVHLLTDILWSSEMCVFKKSRNDFKEELDFIRNAKREWNSLDLKYFKENKNLLSYELIDKEKEVKDYLPYYEKGQLTVQIRYIVDYYKNSEVCNDEKPEYKYLTKNQVDDFIECAVGIIENELKKKGLVL